MHSFGDGFGAAVRALTLAWDRMAAILFRPFDLAKWFALGFTAWLATLGEGGGFRGNFNLPGGGNRGGHSGCGNPAEAMQPVLDWCRAHIQLLIAGAVLLLLVCVAAGVAVCWINSRGRFMFLDNVAYNRRRITEPWAEFRAEGNSLFWWRLWYGLGVQLPLALLWLGGTAWMVAESAGYSLDGLGRIGLWGWLRVVLVAVALMAPPLLAAIVPAFLKAFGVPLMYRYRLKAGAALGYVWRLFKARWKWFVAYFILGIGVGMAWGMAIFALTLVTCCIAGCLMNLPYLGAVLLLPMTVFYTAWRVHFLELVHPELRIFPVPPPPPPPVSASPAPAEPAAG